jgi:hypothetical protein
VGLTLAGWLVGVGGQRAAAAVLLAATALQQSGLGSMPLPLVVRWSVSLEAPGDAIRQRVALPAPDDAAWRRAWARAARVALVVCTEQAVAAETGTTIAVNGRAPAELSMLPRTGVPGGVGWYSLPVPAQVVAGVRHLEVVVRRERPEGPPPQFCGGQDDPTRPGAGGSARWRGGRWDTEQLADLPLPPPASRAPAGRPALGRYYVDLRFYDERGLPSLGVWY